MPPERCRAFAPGRVNLIGEHTDYNCGLALPFAIERGVTVEALAAAPGSSGAEQHVSVRALDLGERDEFALASPAPAAGWRAFARGAVAELAAAGFPLVGAHLQISGELPLGAGLSSSAALEVALALALIELGARALPLRARDVDRIELARVCSRVENDWVGASTGLLDQLASLLGARETALRIDFRDLSIEPVPLRLGDWKLALLDSGERHVISRSGYNERRLECARACELLGVDSLREAGAAAIEQLPEPLRSRAEHVLGENERVRAAVAALRAGDLAALGSLLDASHESLRERYAVSTPALDAAVEVMRRAGASGARMVGGGFGGSVLGLFRAGVELPAGACEVRPGDGARLLDL